MKSKKQILAEKYHIDSVRYTHKRKFNSIAFNETFSYIKTLSPASSKDKVIYILGNNSFPYMCFHILKKDILINRMCLINAYNNIHISNLDLLFDHSKIYKLSHTNIDLNEA